MRMLDLFCGRWGWSKAFAKRGWECVGVDLVEPPGIPKGCLFIQRDVLEIDRLFRSVLGHPGEFDFICASPPCEQFSVWGMRHFHPNPPYPELGIKLFEHTRRICEESGVPYVIENVRAAQQFVGNAVHHCGPFYLWGTGVPLLMPRGIQKGVRLGKSGLSGEAQAEWFRQNDPLHRSPRWWYSSSKKRAEATAMVATIPPELANCVADYAERLLEQRKVVSSTA